MHFSAFIVPVTVTKFLDSCSHGISLCPWRLHVVLYCKLKWLRVVVPVVRKFVFYGRHFLAYNPLYVHFLRR